MCMTSSHKGCKIATVLACLMLKSRTSLLFFVPAVESQWDAKIGEQLSHHMRLPFSYFWHGSGLQEREGV